MNGWRAELLAVAIGGTALAVAGSAVSRPAETLLAGATVYLAWHAFQFFRFRRRTAGGRLKPPYPPGAWRDVYGLVAGLQIDRRRAQKNLARFDARFREAAAKFPDALTVVSRSHNVRWCNPIAEELLFGQELKEIRHRKLEDLLQSNTLTVYLAAGRFDRPLTLSPAQGRRRVLNIRVMPFGKKKHQLLIVASDITRVHHLDAARRDFVANLSHELRTPLTVITGYLEMLTEHLKDEAEWANSLGLMDQQASRMRGMLDELTLLSRLETEEKPPREERIDVVGLIERIVDEARAVDESGWRQIDMQIDDDLQLRGDPLELHSALSNLVVNAIRHTPPGTRIQVSWSRRADGAAFSVADDGPGIDTEHLPRLTERFYRIDRARSRSSGGTGLGLAIVKHVMNRHGGELVIESRPGSGSLFECRFPQDRVIEAAPGDGRETA